ncbi:MAG: ABC transporter ATPase [Bacteroidota bacterium]|nr:ABC transporter ATPase [Bacteroidota bacterium]
MLTNFNTTSDQSRIWIYASEQKLTDKQEEYIIKSISDHLQSWEAHKVPLTAGVTILENHFIIIALDESKNGASGCSIDTLQNTIQEIEKELSVSLLNRLNVFCRVDDTIKCIPTTKLAENVNKDTLFYDLTIQKKDELSNWLKPIKEGWCINLLN